MPWRRDRHAPSGLAMTELCMGNLRALKAISKVPIHMGPFVQSTTGAIAPFFNDSRALYSHPKEFKIFVEELTKIIKKYTNMRRSDPRSDKGRTLRRGIDLIVGIPMAGIPLAMALSIKTGIPFAYLLKERKKTLRQRLIEGEYKKGARALLVDDVIGTGGTFTKGIRDCRKEGIIVKHLMTLWNPWRAKNRMFLAKMQKRGITYDTLYTRHDWIDYLHKHGLASDEMVEIQKAYLADVTGWHKDKAMWKRFLAWKRKYKRTGNM